jgi:hypothetical protein
MKPYSTAKYTGATPGADSNAYELFSTVTAEWPVNALALMGIHRILLDLAHNQNGTLRWYRSDDRGENWILMGVEAITAPTNETNIRDWLVEGSPDWQLTWTNAGTAQTVWSPKIVLLDTRLPAA